MVYGLEAKEREQKEADRFQCVSPTCQAALADVLTVIFSEMVGLLSPSGTLPAVVEERTPPSLAVNPLD